MASRAALARLCWIAVAIAGALGAIVLGARLGELAYLPHEVTCPDTAIGAALVLEARDALTGDPIPDVRGAARLEIRDSLGARSIAFPWERDGPYWLAGVGRAGRYSAHVTAAGYLPWDTAGIVVPLEPCGPVGRKLTVRLRRAR